MVVIKKIEPQTCELYDPQGNFVGILNEYEFHDVRVQIREQQLVGYYCKFLINGKEIVFNIDKDGRSNDWCKGIFDTIEDSLDKLL